MKKKMGAILIAMVVVLLSSCASMGFYMVSVDDTQAQWRMLNSEEQQELLNGLAPRKGHGEIKTEKEMTIAQMEAEIFITEGLKSFNPNTKGCALKALAWYKTWSNAKKFLHFNGIYETLGRETLFDPKMDEWRSVKFIENGEEIPWKQVKNWLRGESIAHAIEERSEKDIFNYVREDLELTFAYLVLSEKDIVAEYSSFYDSTDNHEVEIRNYEMKNVLFVDPIREDYWFKRSYNFSTPRENNVDIRVVPLPPSE